MFFSRNKENIISFQIFMVSTVCLKNGYLRVKWNSLSPCSGQFFQHTLKDNQPTSAVSALITTVIWSTESALYRIKRCTTLRRKTVDCRSLCWQMLAECPFHRITIWSTIFFIGATNGRKLFALIAVSQDSETLLPSDQSYIQQGSLKKWAVITNTDGKTQLQL